MQDLKLDVQFGNALEPKFKIATPAGYKVQLMEPMNKSVGATEIIQIYLFLDAIGFVDWAREKVYDDLWSYLKQLYAKGAKQGNGTMIIKSNKETGEIEIQFENVNESSFKAAQVEVLKVIEKSKDGDKVSTSVKIKIP